MSAVRTSTARTAATTPLAGDVALVTGATSGIGRATALHLAELGAHVIVSGRDTARGEDTVARVRAAGGKADFVRADLANLTSVGELAERAVELGGGHVDVLVNNAAIFPFSSTLDATVADFDATFDTNVKAPFFLVQALVPQMVERGRGSIVNITTVAAQFGMPVGAVYGASKSALVLLTKSWAAEFGPSGVRVNAVSPGPIKTEGTEPFGDMVDELAASTIAGRLGEPHEVASLVGFLAGPGATYVQGAVWGVDGGRGAI